MDERVPGPAPLPSFHGPGCRCNQFARPDCPARATPEGRRRDQQRLLKRAEMRVIEADEAIQAALREKTAAVTALNDLKRQSDSAGESHG